jgi:flagellar protein FlaG
MLEFGEANVSTKADISRSAQTIAANRQAQNEPASRQAQSEQTNRAAQNQTAAPMPPRAAEQPRTQTTAEVDAAARLSSVSEGEVSMQVREINTHLLGRNLELNYKRHEGTNQYFLTILNSETNEVVREIPPERSLDMLARIWEMTGIFISERG